MDPEMIEAIGRRIFETFDCETVVRPVIEVPEGSYEKERHQFSSSVVLQHLVGICPGDAYRMLGVTQCDLFIPMLSFVFGQAQLNGRVALLSLSRLHQEFYGLPEDRPVWRERTLKETLHELGHTFGLIHCLEKECPMALSTTIQLLDRKGSEYCRSCLLMLREAMRMGASGVEL